MSEKWPRDPLEVDARRLGRHLQERGVGPLADLGPAVEDVEPASAVVRPAHRRGGGLGLAALGEAEAETDVLVAAGEATAPAQAVSSRGSEATERNGPPGQRPDRRRPRVGAGLDHAGSATPAGIGVLGDARCSLAQQVAPPSSTGSMPRRSASLFIWLSATKQPWGPPKPRKAPPGTEWV